MNINFGFNNFGDIKIDIVFYQIFVDALQMKYLIVLYHFFVDNLPTFDLIEWLFPLSILYSFVLLSIAGMMKERMQWNTGYSRKIYHFGIFILAGILQSKYGLGGTFIIGWAATISVFTAVTLGEKSLLYRALGREKDSPHITYYILAPYFATLMGGIINNLILGKIYAIYGYFLTGIGDAVGEPIGVKWGTVQICNTQRTVQGTMGVILFNFFALVLAHYFIEGEWTVMPIFIFISLFCAKVEIISPHGWDNLTTQVCAAVTMYIFL